MLNICPGYLDDAGVWNNGFGCQPINNRPRVCCGPDNRRECCFVDQLRQQSDMSVDSDLSLSSLLSSSLSNKNESTIAITPSSYILILIAIGITLALLIVLLVVSIYVLRRKYNTSSSSSCSSASSSLDKHSRRLSVAIASSSKSSASSPVPSTYVDYWSRTIISPSEWTLTKPYTSFLGGNTSTNHSNYYMDQ